MVCKKCPRDMHLYKLFLKPSEVGSMCHSSQLRVKDLQGVMPDLRKKAFWKLLTTGKVDSSFGFRHTNSLSCGYLGVAEKL